MVDKQEENSSVEEILRCKNLTLAIVLAIVALGFYIGFFLIYA